MREIEGCALQSDGNAVHTLRGEGWARVAVLVLVHRLDEKVVIGARRLAGTGARPDSLI